MLGGFIVSMFPWEGIFLINVPVGILSLVIGHFTLPRSSPECAGQSMDVKGAVLLVPGMLLTFLSVTMMPVSYTHLDVYKRQVSVCTI